MPTSKTEEKITDIEERKTEKSFKSVKDEVAGEEEDEEDDDEP